MRSLQDQLELHFVPSQIRCRLSRALAVHADAWGWKTCPKLKDHWPLRGFLAILTILFWVELVRISESYSAHVRCLAIPRIRGLSQCMSAPAQLSVAAKQAEEHKNQLGLLAYGHA